MGGIKQRQIEHAEREKADQQPPTTLGDLQLEGVPVFCWCNRCGHNATLETSRLSAELGPGFPVPEVGPRLRCSGCGAKDIAVRPAWPSLGQVARHG